MTADAELVQLGCELLEDLGIANFIVRINNRKILTGLMASIGVEPGEREMGVLRTIDKLPKIGKEETARLLSVENGLEGGLVGKVFEFLEVRGNSGEVLDAIERMFGPGGALAGPAGKAALDGARELKEVFAILEGTGAARKVEVDLSIARGLNYYTGTIYETFLGDLPGYGSVMSGGRYDGLIGVFKGDDVPAVGISLGVDRLLEGLVELKLLGEEKSVSRVLVALFGPETAAYSARAARLLRAAGIACELHPSYAKVAKQLRHAERNGQRWVVLAGTDEMAKGEVSVKDLETGKQETMALEALSAYLAGKL
jgi:histidyl-tRNA synthetase